MTDRTKPPSDEVMGKVVAKWKGHTNVQRFKAGGMSMFRWWDSNGVLVNSCFDPRTDTDAALELLGWLEEQDHARVVMYVYKSPYDPRIDGACFGADTRKGLVMIPISGKPFRTAVCCLAAEVLGVAE